MTKRTVFLIAVLFSGLLFSGCISSGTYFRPVDYVVSKPFYYKNLNKLAVLVKNGNKYEKRQIEAGALSALISNSYTISSRADLKSLLKEINFQQSSLTDSDSAKFGKIMNVPAVLVFGLRKEKDVYSSDKKLIYYSLDARLIDVETAEVLYIAKSSGHTLEKLAFSLAFEIPPHAGVRAKIVDLKTQGMRYVAKGDWKRLTTVVSTHSSVSKFKRIAILTDFKNKHIRNEAEDLFTMELIRQGVSVSSRSDLASVVKEINFQHSGLSDNSSVKLGKMLNVPAVMILSDKIYKKKTCKANRSYRCTEFGIMAKVIDVQTGEIVLIGGQETGGTISDTNFETYYLNKMLRKASLDVASHF